MLPSSGSTLSIGMINVEKGVSSGTTNSSLQQLTFDFSGSSVDQNQPYAISEFYGKSYSQVYYVVQMCGTGTQYTIIGDTNPSIGSVYKLYKPTCFGGFDGNICWEIVATVPSYDSSLDCSGVTFNAVYESCIACGG
jgi:hypothetical protein